MFQQQQQQAIVIYWNENRVSCEQSLSINYDACLNAKEKEGQSKKYLFILQKAVQTAMWLEKKKKRDFFDKKYNFILKCFVLT